MSYKGVKRERTQTFLLHARTCPAGQATEKGCALGDGDIQHAQLCRAAADMTCGVLTALLGTCGEAGHMGSTGSRAACCQLRQ